MSLRVAITGANGFLGAELSRRLRAAGVEVHALTRQPPASPELRWQAYDLADPDPVIPPGTEVVVHGAFAMGRTGLALEQLNVAAAARLHRAARAQGAHFVFISSMSAHDAALSSYGRAKWQIEKALDPARDAIVRPGLIVGPGGVYARMLDSVRRTPLVPIFYGGTQPIQPVALADITCALERIIVRRLPGVFNIGLGTVLTMREFYAQIMTAAGVQRPVVPLPADLFLPALRLAENCGLRLPVTVENLLGQKKLRRSDPTDSLSRLGLTLTPLAELPWAPSPSTP